jgi:hypothetical protein
MRFIDRILGHKNEDAKDAGAGIGKPEWRRVGVYFYRADGRYPAPTWAENPQQFNDLIPDIRRQIESKLELRITNGDDHLLFHSTKRGIEWDGIRLGHFLEHDRESHAASKKDTHISHDR